MTTLQTRSKLSKSSNNQQTRSVFAALGLIGLVTGCNPVLAQHNKIDPPASLRTVPILPVLKPTPTPLVAQPILSPLPTATPWSTPTPWPTPAAWQPKLALLPTLAPVPVIPASFVQPGSSLPISYSPPDGVDVFGSTVLRWTYGGALAEDEFFDIRIKPAGSNDSAFVDWSKSPEYLLQSWSGWQPGLYTWQIGIIKGYLDGSTKHFIADTARDSHPFLIKW